MHKLEAFDHSSKSSIEPEDQNQNRKAVSEADMLNGIV